MERRHLGEPAQRARAARATIEAGSGLLPGDGALRLAELGIFAEDESVPVGLLLLLWRASAGLDPMAGRRLCVRMDQLSLITLDPDRGVVSLHDVVRDFMRAQLGEARIATLDGLLVDAVAAGLPAARPLVEGVPCPAVAWWELDEDQPYLWDYLVAHLLAAGRVDEADAVAGDLRWVGARLRRFGPVAPFTDLSSVPGSRAPSLRAGLSRVAHLLAPTDPARFVVDVLHSRLHQEASWAPQVVAVQTTLGRTRLVNHWPLPDLPHPALRRNVTGHSYAVHAVAVAPAGTWIVSAGRDGSVRIWEVATGRERARLTGSTGWVRALAVAPDGTWIVSAGGDGSVRIWEVATGRERARLTGHARWVNAVAVAPDGTWIASAGDRESSVRIWDVATGQERARGPDHAGAVSAVAVAPDGSWVASAGDFDGSVRIWEVATGRQRARLTGHTSWVNAVAVAPNGTWIAGVGNDGSLCVWEVATGRCAAMMRVDGDLYDCAWSADSAMVTAAGNRGVYLFDLLSPLES
ncbi:hypothetical protein ND748_16265 [Frankia sp. AiPs1]|uniref:WD40 repeat domain-containing protein n=1 Tax=Frankia sp. AiPs1 TaxID=573493 RepID=UPI0020443B5A|nr:hypothetical protein [Frankia sp. AiPs1]MCM3923209.1 hypothetical protein [Frankia sp. AiPs1]